MGLWRLGRPATLSDCGELFGLSDGFVDHWTPIVLHFIRDNFGDRLWKSEREVTQTRFVGYKLRPITLQAFPPRVTPPPGLASPRPFSNAQDFRPASALGMESCFQFTTKREPMDPFTSPAKGFTQSIFRWLSMQTCDSCTLEEASLAQCTMVTAGIAYLSAND